MRHFELSFSPRDRPDLLVAPQYLPLESPDRKAVARAEKTYTLAFRLRFPDFMPRSLFLRFIARYGQYATDTFWKNGIFFLHDDYNIEVLAQCTFGAEKTISVWLQQPQRELLSELFAYFRPELGSSTEIAVKGEFVHKAK
jgi:C-terminal of Roc, COR, domain